MLQALAKTIGAYETLIADVERNKAKWYDYGSSRSCRLCDAAPRRPASAWMLERDCSQCVLGPKDHGCVDDTYSEFNRALRILDDQGVVKAAKARLAWIVARCKENGIDVKELE